MAASGVRQLSQCLLVQRRRRAALAQGMPHLPPEGLSLKERMAQIERSIIEQALERNSGNVSRTAKLLNLQRTTLIEKINKYELRSA